MQYVKPGSKWVIETITIMTTIDFEILWLGNFNYGSDTLSCMASKSTLKGDPSR